MLCIISAKLINNYIVHEELQLSFQCFHAINADENVHRGHAYVSSNDCDFCDHDHDDHDLCDRDDHDLYDRDDHGLCDLDFPYILRAYVY